LKQTVIRYWRKVHDEELHNSYSSPNIFKVLKSRGRCDFSITFNTHEEDNRIHYFNDKA
jgi:hypothetical protein